MDIMQLPHEAIGTQSDRVYMFHLPEPINLMGDRIEVIRIMRGRVNGRGTSEPKPNCWLTEALDSRGRSRHYCRTDNWSSAVASAQDVLNDLEEASIHYM